MEPTAAPPGETLAALRARIEAVDAQVIRLLAERASLARATHAVKRSLDRPTLDPAREAAVVRRAGSLARAAGLPEDPVRELYWIILSLSRDVQHGDGP